MLDSATPIQVSPVLRPFGVENELAGVFVAWVHQTLAIIQKYSSHPWSTSKTWGLLPSKTKLIQLNGRKFCWKIKHLKVCAINRRRLELDCGGEAWGHGRSGCCRWRLSSGSTLGCAMRWEDQQNLLWCTSWRRGPVDLVHHWWRMQWCWCFWLGT